MADATEAGFFVPQGLMKKKFVCPSVPTSYVGDERMERRVAAIETWRACFVNAAPGFGKTTALSRWFELFAANDSTCPLWISATASDKVPLGFLTSLYTAFQRVDRAFVEALPPRGADFEERLSTFVNLVDSHVEPDMSYVVFLDEYECASSAENDRMIAFLCRYLPDNVHLAVSGGRPHEILGDALLTVSVLEFDNRDFVLDEERFYRLAHNLMGELSQAEIDSCYRMSSGWPALLKFYSLARTRAGERGNPAHYLNEYLNRFFDQHVTSRVDGETSEFLIETSILENMTAPVCERVTGNPRSGHILEYLLNESVFTFFDPQLECYRYQGAFLRFLHEKLLSLRLEQISNLAYHASAWYFQAGEMASGFKYLVLSCDPYYLEGSVRGSTDLHRPSGYENLTEFLLDVPASRYPRDLYLLWLSTWASIASGLIDEADYCIGRIAGLDARDINRSARDSATAICLALRDRTQEALDMIVQILERGDELSGSFRCLLVHMEAECTERLGQVKKSRALYQKALSFSERESAPFFRLFDYYLLAHQNLDIGNLDSAIRLSQHAIKETMAGSPLRGEFCAIIASALVSQGELDEAEGYMNRALANVTPGSNVDMYIDIQTCHACYLMARGKDAAALEAVDNALEVTKGKNVPRHLEFEAIAVKAIIAARLGDLATAESCEHSLDEFADNPDVLRTMLCVQAKGAIEMLRENWDGAVSLFDCAREMARKCGSVQVDAEASLALAVLFEQRGDHDQAMVELVRSLKLSLKEGNVGVYFRYGAHARDLLLEVATSRKAARPLRDFAKRVLSLADTDDAAPEAEELQDELSLGLYALTSREQEVLKMLNAGMSRKEISTAMSISENTVKSHLKNVYSKLGVHTRSEAYRATLESDEGQENA